MWLLWLYCDIRTVTLIATIWLLFGALYYFVLTYYYIGLFTTDDDDPTTTSTSSSLTSKERSMLQSILGFAFMHIIIAFLALWGVTTKRKWPIQFSIGCLCISITLLLWDTILFIGIPSFMILFAGVTIQLLLILISQYSYLKEVKEEENGLIIIRESNDTNNGPYYQVVGTTTSADDSGFVYEKMNDELV